MAMALKFLVAFAALAIAGLTLQTTEAATYVVGDSFGWQTPPDNTFYSTWASSKIFRVGDILVFNFTAGDDVARVRTQQNFNDCDDDPEDIISRVTTGPGNFTLDTAGMYYFISTIDNDNSNNNDDKCERGQRLAINVVAGSTTPAAPPTTPPRTTPAPPTTTTKPTVYVVGDAFGWQTPPNNTFYSNWASKKTFRAGDILTFNFTTGDDVAMVRTQENFNDCDDDAEDIIARYTTGPVNVTLNATGTYYFISTIDNDNNNNNDDKCERGQRVAITVVAASTTPAAPPTTTPSTPTTTPTKPTVHIVGDAFGWQTPPNSTFYTTWASTRTFAVGDTLVFNFSAGDDVARVRTQENFNDCDDDSEDIITRFTTGPANFTLDTTGMYYFISTIDNDNNNNSDDKCERGQRLAINVVAASTTPGTTTPSTTGSTPGSSAFSPNGAPAVPGSAASFAANGALAIAVSAAMLFI